MKDQPITITNNSQIVRKARRLTTFLTIAVLLIFKPSLAQVNVQINIGTQPLWGPVNYDYAEYYYLPEADVFYYVPTGQFIYWNTGRWVFVGSLPTMYHVDLYRTYKVVVNESKPYMRHQVYFKKYGKYKTVRGKQIVIRDSRDKKYYVVKGHPGNTKAKAANPSSANPNNSKASNSKSGNSKTVSPKPSNSNPNGSKGNGKRK